MAGGVVSWLDLERAALKASAVVSPVALRFYHGSVAAREKCDASLVSEADVAVEQALRVQLLKETDKLGLSAGFQGEESGSSGFEGADGYWLVDPIDGTAAFLSGVPTWSLLIAFISHGRPRVGVVAFPALGLVFCSHEGGRAVYGPLDERTALGVRPKRRCHLAPSVSLHDARIHYSSPTQFFVRGMDQLWVSLAKQVREFRTFGDAFGYASVLQGKAHAALDPIAAPYDLAAIEVLFMTTPGAVFRSFLPSPASSVFATGGAIGACHPDVADKITEARDGAELMRSRQNGSSADLSVHFATATEPSTRLNRQDDLAKLSVLMLEAAKLSWTCRKDPPPAGPEDVIVTFWTATELGAKHSRIGNQRIFVSQGFFLTLRDEKPDSPLNFADGPVTKSKFRKLYRSLLSLYADKKMSHSKQGRTQPAPCAIVGSEIVWSEKDQLKASQVCQEVTQKRTSKSKESLEIFWLRRRVMDVLGQDRQADFLFLVKPDSRRSLMRIFSQIAHGQSEFPLGAFPLTPGAGAAVWRRECKQFFDRTE